MSSSHQHQDNQKRHTNIVTVKLKINGKKFEVAAYPNRVRDYRNGIEKNLDEVLQVFQVFENVSRGVHAKTADLVKYFGTKDMEECCKMILMKGELQVSDRERQEEYHAKFRDVATLVAGRCVNTQTGWPYTTSSIETAMRDTIHFAVNPTKSIKLQAMEVIEKLKLHIPIARAKMHLKFIGNTKTWEQLLEAIHSEQVPSITITNVDTDKHQFEVFADPHDFKLLEQLAKKFEVSTSILEFSVQATTETDLEDVVEVIHSSSTGSSGGGGGVTSINTTTGTGNDISSTVRKDKSDIPMVVVISTSTTTSTGGNDVTTGGTGAAGKTFKCSVCRLEFPDTNSHRTHCKTEFHTYNLKLKQVGLPIVTSTEFSNMNDEDKRAVLFDWKQDD
jgi:ribosome maturation protein SDO1